MEVCIENFTPTGNNLMFRKDFENYQKEKCKSKTMARMENTIHYNRILDGLTDNRSIDILNDASLENIRKMDTREYIIKYIQENKSVKTPEQLVMGLAITLNVPVANNAGMKVLYNMVLRELQTNPPTLAEISIAVDGVSVPIIANDFGVRAGANNFSFQGIPSQSVDQETGELSAVEWSGDNQVPVRNFTFLGNNSGNRITEVPAQFSLPSNLPPPMMPVVYDRLALPDTNIVEPAIYPTAQRGPNLDLLRGLFAPEPNNMATQTEGDYPPSVLEMTKSNVATYTTSKKVNSGRLTQTAQTGESGMIATPAMRNKYPSGGYSGKERLSTPRGTRPDYDAISQASSTASGAVVFSPFNLYDN